MGSASLGGACEGVSPFLSTWQAPTSMLGSLVMVRDSLPRNFQCRHLNASA